MAEYIDRDLTEKALMERCNETGYGGLNRTDVKMVMRTPWRIPNADVVERKHGKWIIEDKYSDYRTERCSICGFVANRTYIRDIWNFCPNCGADNRKSGGKEG